MCFSTCLTLLTNILVNAYFTDSYCSFLIAQHGLDYKGNATIVNLSDFSKNNAEFLRFGCQNIVVARDEPRRAIEELEQQMKVQLQRYNRRKYLVLPTAESAADLYNLTLMPALHFVPDVLVIVPENGFNVSVHYSLEPLMQECALKFQLWTHRFTGLTNSDDIVLLDSFHCRNGSFQHGSDLYPDKITNMEGKLFKIATFNYQPYSIIDESKHTVDGTEMRIALEYAKKHNCTTQLVLDEENQWGEIFDNWTGNGILGNIVTDNADIGLGALYTWYHEFKFLDLSMPTSRTGITCLAPAPRLQSGWLVPFFPFNLVLWIAVIITFVFTIFAYFCVLHLNVKQINRENPKENVQIDEPFLIVYMMIRIFLLQSWTSLKTFDRESLRYLLSSFLIVSLLIATCYNSGLSSSLTVPRYEKAIKTVRELADSNLNWGETHEAWIFSILCATEPNIVKLLKNFKILQGRDLPKLIPTRRYAFPLERLSAGHYAVSSHITKEHMPFLLLMSEDIYWEYCVIMARKNSPFLPTINKLMLQLHETGLPFVWESQVALKYLDYHVQLQISLFSQQKHPSEEPTKLKIAHIQGTYIIWLGGLLFATFIFFVELCVSKYKNRSKVSYYQ